MLNRVERTAKAMRTLEYPSIKLPPWDERTIHNGSLP